MDEDMSPRSLGTASGAFGSGGEGGGFVGILEGSVRGSKRCEATFVDLDSNAIALILSSLPRY